MTKKFNKRTSIAICTFALASMGSAGWVHAEGSTSGGSGAQTGPDTSMGGSGYGSDQSGASSGSSQQQQQQQRSGQSTDAMEQVNNAAQVVKRMEADQQVQKLLQQSKGVFIVPNYARGGLGIAARGGEGVMLANNNGKWSNPVFYNFGGVSIGAQAGAEAGSIAMILMNEKAVKNFMQENNFSLTADAGLTIVNYTAKAQTSAGRGDVIVWADTKGALADVAIGITDISYDDDENAAFYKSKKVAARDIINGKVTSAQAKPLTQELSSGQ